MFHLLASRGRCFTFEPRATVQRARHSQLIRHDLHGHCEIQRTEIRVGRYREQCVAKIEIIVMQTRFLGAKYSGDLALFPFQHHALGTIPRTHGGPPESSRACTGTRHIDAVRQRFGEGGNNHGGIQYVGRPRCTGDSLVVREMPGIHERQITQAHILHRTRDSADISGMCGSYEHDSYGHLLRDSSLKVRYSTAPAAWADNNVAVFAQFFDIDGIDMHALLNVAVMAARRAGAVLGRNFNKRDKLTVEMKGHSDFVSSADIAAERAIIDVIHKHYPDHAILAEESGAQGDSDHVWIIDPLDGTTNYLHGFPVFAVSIGLQINGRLEHAVVYDPMREELFTASRGQGAQLDEHKIRVSGIKDLDRALVGTGFPVRQADREMSPYLAMLGKVVKNTSGVRRPGAAALDLCYVACGRLDAFWETGLQPWDLAAGTLILREAGGIISALDGGENHMVTGHVLAGTPRIYKGLAKLCAKEIKAILT
jgi:myo-inositol-1(or 4)-monophosphatase